MRLSEDLVVVEAESRELPRQAEDEGEVLVGPVLPSAGPHELEALRQAGQVGAGTLADPVRDAVHCMEAAWWGSGAVEAEEADHPVDVDEENGPFAGTLLQRINS